MSAAGLSELGASLGCEGACFAGRVCSTDGVYTPRCAEGEVQRQSQVARRCLDTARRHCEAPGFGGGAIAGFPVIDKVGTG